MAGVKKSQRVITACRGVTQGGLQIAVRVSPPDNPETLKELAWINSAIICLIFEAVISVISNMLKEVANAQFQFIPQLGKSKNKEDVDLVLKQDQVLQRQNYFSLEVFKNILLPKNPVFVPVFQNIENRQCLCPLFIQFPSSQKSKYHRGGGSLKLSILLALKGIFCTQF